jgi:hypothetical protein
MTIIPVSNTNDIRGKQFRGVQAANDDAAVKSLAAIAQRDGLTFTTVYRWGNPENPYYYAVIAS